MTKIENTMDDNVKERGLLFNELRNLLEAHSNAEERIVYQTLEDDDEVGPLILESYEDHKVVAELLQSLSEMEFDHEEWLPKFALLKENVLQHVETEEAKLLPYIAESVDDDEREEMADDMKSLEEEIVSAGPESVTQTPAQSSLGTNV